MAKEYLRFARTISLLTLISRILGLVRDMVCSHLFGAGMVWDAFVWAFTIPNIFRRFFGEGAFNSAFIPVFTDSLERESRKETQRLANVILSTLFLVLLAFVLAGIAAAWLIPLSWFKPEEEKAGLTLKLLALLFPYLLFICLVAGLSGILNSLKHFFAPAMAPPLLNIAWILGALFLVPLFGKTSQERIFGIAAAVLAGGLFQLCIQVPPLRRRGFGLTFRLDFNHPGLRRVFLLMGPVIIGLAPVQVNVIVDRVIAERFIEGDGAVSVLFYGDRLMQFPLAIIGLAIANASFPLFARFASRGDHKALSRALCDALRMTLFISFPAALGLFLLGLPLVRLLFEHGEFVREKALYTSRALMGYAPGIPFFCGSHLLIRAYYSLKDTRTPTLIAFAAMLVNAALNLILVFPLREAGLALATSLSAALNFFCLSAWVHRKLPGHSFSPVLRTACLTGLLSIAMGLAVLAAMWILGGAEGEAGNLTARFLRTFLPMGAGAGAFVLSALVLRVKEIEELKELIRKGKEE